MTVYTRPIVVPAWAESGDKVQPTNSEIQSGWTLSAIPPSRQRFNWTLNYNANGVRYLTQRGIPEWNTGEDYPIGAYVQYSGLTYRALLANAGLQPNTNPTQWTRWALTQTETSAVYLTRSLNLSDVASAATSLSNLGGAAKSANLSDLANVTTALSNLGGAPITAFASVISTQGYQKLQGGVIIQWGKQTVSASATTTYSFPLIWPTACLSIVACIGTPGSGTSNANQISVSQYQLQNTYPSGSQVISWIAIGS